MIELQELIYQFVQEVTMGSTNETRQAYLTKLRYMVRFFGDQVDCNAIDRNSLEIFKQDLLERNEKRRGAGTVSGHLSRFTVRTVLVTTRFFFSWAYDRGYVQTNPMQGMRIPREPEVKPKPVIENVAIRLIEAAATNGEHWERSRNVAMLYTLRDTGCRIGGLVTAKLEGLELDQARLWVTEKGDNLRPVFLSPSTVMAMQAWIDWRQAKDPFTDNLFINKFGTNLTRGGVYKVLAKLAREAGIFDRFNPHAFRHAFARDAIEAGIDLSRLSQLLGHASIDITNRYYARWNVDELQRAHAQFTPVQSFPPIQAPVRGVV